MTARAFLWCGYVQPPYRDPYVNSAGQQPKDRSVPKICDFSASKNDVALAVRAARGLGIPDREIYPFLCNDALLPADFNEALYDATAAELRRVVQRIASRARPEDALLFVASNHGERQGLLMNARYDELGDDEPMHLTPAALGECLTGLAGPQLLLFATCHAGAFLSLGDRLNRLVAATCGEDEKYYVTGEEEAAHSPFLHRLLGPWCGVAPGDHASPARVSLDEAFEAARAFEMSREDLIPPARREPLRRGSVAWPPI